jgi:hypothetical protein
VRITSLGFVLLCACGGGTTTSDAGIDSGSRLDAAMIDSGPAPIDAGSDGGSDAGSDAGPTCPCFGEAELVFVEGLGGDRVCVVDMPTGGGGAQTALVETFTEERVAVEAPIGSDGTHYCGYGCLGSGGPGAPCGRGPAHVLMPVSDMAAWTVCHDLIAAHCR